MAQIAPAYPRAHGNDEIASPAFGGARNDNLGSGRNELRPCWTATTVHPQIVQMAQIAPAYRRPHGNDEIATPRLRRGSQ